jgi:hypothetical protein
LQKIEILLLDNIIVTKAKQSKQKRQKEMRSITYNFFCLPTNGEPYRTKTIKVGNICPELENIEKETLIDSVEEIIGGKYADLTPHLKGQRIRIDPSICKESNQWNWVNKALSFDGVLLFRNMNGIIEPELYDHCAAREKKCRMNPFVTIIAGTSAAGTSAAGTSAAGTSAAGTSAAGTSAAGNIVNHLFGDIAMVLFEEHKD